MKTSLSNFTRFDLFPMLAIFGLVLSMAATARAQDKAEPEIVRLSYVRGDVRFSRGNGRAPDLTKPWEQAVPNLPLLTGYAVATGDGRAEIEFECGSVLYLAENSVLLLETLTEVDGVATTDMQLLTGTATVSFHPLPNEVFELRTPTAKVQNRPSVVLPDLFRVDSYLDGAELSLMRGGQALARRWFMASGSQITGNPFPGGADVSKTAADWDAWVGARVTQRARDTAAALKASGLTSFVPGLTDLYNGGTFFSCAPFGTCWEPNGLTDADQQSEPHAADQPATETGAVDESDVASAPDTDAGARVELVALRTGARQTSGEESSAPASGAADAVGPQTPQQDTTAAPAPASGTAVRGKKRKPTFAEYYYPMGWCSPDELHVEALRDPITGKKTVVQADVEDAYPMWPWALCHSGAWVHLHGHATRYTFVVGRKHHHPPVHWIHTKQGNMYVPRHPSDVKGKPPLNLKYGVYEAKNGPLGPFELTDFKATQKYTVLEEAPKEFRDAQLSQFATVARPEITGRVIVAANRSAAPIKFDYSTRNFVQAGTPMAGHTSRPVVVGKLSASGRYSGGSAGDAGGGSGRASSEGSRGGGGRAGGGGRGGDGGSR
ncbi:MAG: FecR domain-containing protein, partial [Candidatus Acidiferrales bacterium]